MKKKRLLSNAELAAFLNQTAMVIKAGITPAEGMDILIEDTISSEGKALLEEISHSCSRGKHFSEALADTGVFPEYVINLVTLGEESGNLDEVLTALADYYDREDDISEGIRSAFAYPLIMIGMMIVIIVILISKVLPIFKQVFAQLGTKMSPLAEKLLGIGDALSNSAVIVTIVLIVLVAAFFLMFKVPSLNKKIRLFLAKFPLTKDFYYNVAAGRFASGMFLSLQSGMDTFKSLDMITELVENENMINKIKIVREELINRSTMPEALSKANVFSNLYTKMISVGYRSGTSDTVMKSISERYEKATYKQLQKLLSIIEPTLVIVLSVIVGIILLSVLLPLMGIMSSIG